MPRSARTASAKKKTQKTTANDNAPATPAKRSAEIVVKGARQHNLKGIDVTLPRDQFVVFTGLSGSGKSSLAFDTLYAEGQRRYVESLNTYARQFLEQLAKPDVEHLEGLPPTLAVEQRSGQANPRSTVATTTEIYDYLRLLYARVGIPHCPRCGRDVRRQTPTEIVDSIRAYPEGTRLYVLAPMIRHKTGDGKATLTRIKREGFVRARIDGEIQEVVGLKTLPEPDKKHTVEAVVDRLVVRDDMATRLADSVELALKSGEGIVVISRQEPYVRDADIERELMAQRLANLRKENASRALDPDAADMPTDAEAIQDNLAGGAGRSVDGWIDEEFSELYACPRCDLFFDELQPASFSFNSPLGACETCDGLGTKMSVDPDLVVPDPHLPLKDAIEPWRRAGARLAGTYRKKLEAFVERFGGRLDQSYNDMDEDLQDILMYGIDEEDAEAEDIQPWEGVLENLERRINSTQSEATRGRLQNYMGETECVDCGGTRLKPFSLGVTVGGINIAEYCSLTIDQALSFLQDAEMSKESAFVARPILREITSRLGFMQSVGLGYLTLDRRAGTLSGGEAQRIRLATQVGSGLVGVAYVLDEPSIGLHQRDTGRLLDTLRHLRDIGNTVIVVEHEAEFIRQADHILDLGPGAGEFGGEIVYQGEFAGLLECEESLTGQYLSGETEIAVPPIRRRPIWRRSLEVKGARQNNLKNLTVQFPLGLLVCVTGVSGSGKSTLVNDVLLKGMRRTLHQAKDRPGEHDGIAGLSNVQEVVEIDQSPLGKTPRSNPATYTGIFNEIRNIFAATKEAQVRGYGSSRFSFNVKGGRCEACQGQGTKRIEMQFLPDVFVTCEVCKGLRFNRETLDIRWRGKTIADVLDMTVTEARSFFQNHPKVQGSLKTLEEVGLGYIRLGQSSITLSGGEAQRVKLAARLTERASATNGSHTVYVLDEPTTGLHFADVARLLTAIRRLVEHGNTVIVIEHNLDLIKCADWVIDLGPEGGDMGGTIVVEGTPEDVADCEKSYTGQFLKPYLDEEGE